MVAAHVRADLGARFAARARTGGLRRALGGRAVGAGGAGRVRFGPGGTINHLGVEVGSTDEVTRAGDRLDVAGLDTEPEPGAVCC